MLNGRAFMRVRGKAKSFPTSLEARQSLPPLEGKWFYQVKQRLFTYNSPPPHTQPQLNLNLPRLCLGLTRTWHCIPPTHRNSMSAISQLLLTRFLFWWNFKCVQKCRDLRINSGKSLKISENDIGEKIATNLENVHPCIQIYAPKIYILTPIVKQNVQTDLKIHMVLLSKSM